MSSRLNETRQELYNPVDLGTSSVLLSASTNSNGFGVAGFNQLTLEFEVTWAAATAVTFFLAFKKDTDTVWKRAQIVSASAAGIDTLVDNQISKGVSASTGFVWERSISFQGNCRIEALTGAGATSDTIKVWAHVGIV